MVMLPPPPPDEHLMHARTQRKLEESDKSERRGILSGGDMVVLLGLGVALSVLVAFLVLAFL